MKRAGLLLLAGLAFSSLAFAFDTYRVGSEIIRVGDAVSRIVEIIGFPAYREPIETKEGGHEGERWQYRITGKSVTLTVRDGTVVAIDQIND